MTPLHLLPRLLCLCLIHCVLFLQVSAQVDLVTEGFETDGEGVRYTSTFLDDCPMNNSDYFKRTNENPLMCAGGGFAGTLTNLQGSWYWASEDPDASANVTLVALDASLYANLQVHVFLATPRVGTSTWETNDFVRIQYRLSGGDAWTTVGQFVGNAEFGGDLQADADLNGVADGGGALLGLNFTEYSYNITGTSSTLQVRVLLDADHAGSEELAFDNIRVSGILSMQDPPVLANIEGTTIMYTEGDPATQVTNTITVSDPDDTNIESGTVQISANFDPTEDVLAATPVGGIIANYNSGTGILTLTGTASLANYQATLRSVTYQNTDVVNPSTATRTVRFQVNDGDENSNFQSRDIAIIPVVNDPVALPYCESFETDGEGTRYTSDAFNEQPGSCDFFYRTNSTPACFTQAVTGPDGTWFWASEDATNGGVDPFAQIVLSPLIATGLADLDFNMLLGVATAAWETDDYVRVHYNMDGGPWTLVGAFYGNGTDLVEDTDLDGVGDGTALTNVLQNFTFSFNASGTNLNVRIQVKSNGTEELVFDNICVSGMAGQSAPTLSNIEMTAIDYLEGDPPVQVTNTITITDPDDTNMESGVVSICTNFVSGEDILSYTSFGGITGSYNAGTGELTLTGSASIADWESVLRSVTYENTNTMNPSNAVRDVCFQVNDGDINSNQESRMINVFEFLDDAGCLPYVESFETDGEGVRYASNAYEDGCDFFIRTNMTPACHHFPVAGIDGSWFWASEDVVSDGNGNVAGSLLLPPLDVTDFTAIEVSILFGLADTNSVAWENTDNILVEYSMDGGAWTTFGLLQGDAAFGGALRVDTDNNPGTFGPYGAAIPALTTIDLTFAVPVTGTTLEVRILLDQNGGSEELVFDNIRVEGTYVGLGAVMCNDVTVYLPQGNYTFPPEDSALIVNGTDECAGYTVLFDPAFLTCDDIGVNSVTVYFEDAMGAIVDSCESQVTLLDTIPPLAICQNITVFLNGAGNATITAADVDAGSTDNCGPPAVSIDISSFSCADLGPNAVTLTADDGTNTSTCLATVTVADTVSPVAVCQDITVYLDGAGNATITAADVDAGSTDNCGSPALSIDISSFTCADIGANAIMLTADDGTNTATCSATVTVADTSAPTAVCQDITISLDTAGFAFIVPALVDGGSSDNCGITTMALSQSVFDCDDYALSPVTVVLTVMDGAGNVDTCSALVTILDTLIVCCEGPVAVCQDITIFLDGQGAASITAPDVDGGSMADCGLQSLTVSPLTFDCGAVGPNQVLLTVTDINGNMTACSAIVTVMDTIFPTIACPADITTECGPGDLPAPDPGSVVAQDNCPGVVATFISDVSAGTCPEVVTRTYRATDASGNARDCEQTITINDTTPPEISCPEDNVIDCSERSCLTFDAYDVDPVGAPIVISSVDIDGVTINISAWKKGGVLMNATLYDSDEPLPADADLGAPNTKFGGPGENALDADGFNETNNQHLGNLLIVQTPGVGYPNDHIISDSLVFNFSVPVFVLGLKTVDFEMEQVNTGAGAFMYDETGVSLGYVGLNPVLGGDNSVQELILNTPGVKKLVVYFGGVVPSSGGVTDLCFIYVPDAVVVTDACNDFTSDYTEQTIVIDSCTALVTRTYTAQDICGNSAAQSCTITLYEDYGQPDIICPADITINCEEEVPAPEPNAVVATDNCFSSNNITVVWVEDISEGTECAEVIRRIYRATDGCGNESLCAQFITRQAPPPQVELLARTFLEAVMIGDTIMDGRLNDMGYLPHAQPYTAMPYDYWGTEECADMAPVIVDWLYVQLRDVLTMEVIAERAGLVREDGAIVDLDGVSAVTFEAPGDWYYVVICHRNHLDISSDLPIDCTDGTGDYDFTVGGSIDGMAELENGTYAMICGDVNGDNLVKYNGAANDKNAILSAVGILTPNNIVPGYNNYDVNMDGVVKFNGSGNDKNAVLTIVGVLTPNNIVTGQMH